MINSNGKGFVLQAVAVFLVVVGSLSVMSFVSAKETEETENSITSLNSPTGEIEVNMFYPTDNVYAMGSGMEPENYYTIYIVENTRWIKNSTTISQCVVVRSIPNVLTNEYGEFGPILVWATPLTPGYYDIIADCETAGTPGTYDGCDALDDFEVKGAGFFVVTEFAPILAVVACYAATFAVMMFKRRRSSQPPIVSKAT